MGFFDNENVFILKRPLPIISISLSIDNYESENAV